MPAVLTPEERGPHAWWAYDSRDRLGLSDVQVAAALPGPRRGEKYNPATIRKGETNDRHMSKPLWRQVTRFYTERARTEGIALEPVPGGSPAEVPPTGDQSALIKALDRQSQVMEALVILLARREGISLDELATEEGSMLRRLGHLLQDDLRTATTEAIERDRTRKPEAPQPPDRKRPTLVPAKP